MVYVSGWNVWREWNVTPKEPPSILQFFHHWLLYNIWAHNASVLVEHQVLDHSFSPCVCLSSQKDEQCQDWTTSDNGSMSCREMCIRNRVTCRPCRMYTKTVYRREKHSVAVLLLFPSSALRPLRSSVMQHSNSGLVRACKCCKAQRTNIDLAV